MSYTAKAPSYFRTPTGMVFGPMGRMTLHRGYWWNDAGSPVAPEGAEVNLPVRNEDGTEPTTEGVTDDTAEK